MDASALFSSRQVAAFLKLEKDAVLDMAGRRLLPKIQPSKRRVLFNLDHVKLVLAKLTIWELQYGDPRPIGDEILTGPELAQRLAFTFSKVRALTRQRFIPHIKLGRVVRYCLAAVLYALDNLISVRECAKRLGLSRWQIFDSVSGPGRTLPVLRLGKRCLRYHWPSVQAALARASAKSTVVPI